MTDPDQTSVDLLLAAAARTIPIPDPDSFAGAVAARLRSQPSNDLPSRQVPGGRRWRPPVTVAVALVAACAVVAAFVPTVRSTLADLVGGDGAPRAVPVLVPASAPSRPRPTNPPPSGSPTTTTPPDPVAALQLGTRSTLLQAARVVGFPMRLPTAGGYQQPDEVFVGSPPTAGTASMVYLPKTGRPAAPGGLAALLSEFRGHLDPGAIERLAGNGVGVQAVRVSGARGFWLSGAPPIFPYVKPDGTVGTQTIRLATNTLVWSFGGIAYLFESAQSRDAAIAISMR
jgi:hypothetical protein